MKAVCLLAMAALALPDMAWAGTFYDGNRLHEHCMENRIYAHMYIVGIVDGVDSLAGVINGSPYCLPENVKARQVSDVACNFLRDHPEQRQYAAASLVVGAMMKAFPCQK